MKKLSLDQLNRCSIPEFKSKNKYPIIVILDNIRSAHNVGSFFRMSDAFSIESIQLTGISAQPPHREINKTALGATLSVDWTYTEHITVLIKNLKREGIKIIGVEQTDESIYLNKWIPAITGKTALIFGNEVSGISSEVLPLLDQAIEIPQFGTKHSLNVAVSGGIVLWHLVQYHL